MEPTDLNQGPHSEPEEVRGGSAGTPGARSTSRLMEAMTSSADAAFDLEKFLTEESACEALLQWLGPRTLGQMKGKRQVLQKLRIDVKTGQNHTHGSTLLRKDGWYRVAR